MDISKAAYVPFYDEKQGLRPPTPPELEERCCHGGHHRHNRRWGRLIKALAFLGTIFIGYKTLVECVRIKYGIYHGHELSEKAIISSVESLIHPDIVIDYCTDWSLDSKAKHEDHKNRRRSPLDLLYEPRSSSASFDLPLSSDKLFLYSRGATAGSFKLVQSPDIDPSEGVARVVVVAKYRGWSALKQVKVCSVTRGDTENGVMIFTPKLSKHVRVGFETTVYLPRTVEEGSTLRLKSFETDLPLFVHSVGDIGPRVQFDEVVLKTANMPVGVESLSASKALISTTNAAIHGSFNVSESLQLFTANAKIGANIGLSNDGEQGVTDVVIKTTHAPIKATLSLVSTTTTSSGGKFQILATTALAPLTLSVLSSDRLSTLLLTAHTSLAPASVSLPDTYEGQFTIATRLAKPEVFLDNVYDDRKVEYTPVERGQVKGSVWWEGEHGEEGRERGFVDVKTSLAPVALRL